MSAQENLSTESKHQANENEGPFVINWDGKIVEEFLEVKQERIVVISTGGEYKRNGKLLGIPCISSSTGLNQASAAFHLAKEWNSADKVVGTVFDTTAINNGKHPRAAAILERHFKRKLMWLTCHHHTIELVVWDVGKTLWCHFRAIKSFLHCNPQKIWWNSKKKTTTSQSMEDGCCFKDKIW